MFRFAIRDLLWLTVVVALGMAWWVEHRKARHDRLRAEVLELQLQSANETLDELLPGWRRIAWEKRWQWRHYGPRDSKSRPPNP